MEKENESLKAKKKDSKLVKKIKQNIYKWHRTLGIITIIPVIFWCLSGLTHPFMAHFFKPEIKNEKLAVLPIDKSQLHFSIQEVLQKNRISEFKNFRIITFNKVTFYQLKTLKGELLYFSTFDAKPLANGDQKYAEWLSRYFLDDQKSGVKNSLILLHNINTSTAIYRFTNSRLIAQTVCKFM